MTHVTFTCLRHKRSVAANVRLMWSTVKVKLSLCLIKYHAMKTYAGDGIASSFLDVGITWRWGVSFTPRPLYPQGKSSGTHRTGGGWTSESVLTLWRTENLLLLPQIEFRSSSPKVGQFSDVSRIMWSRLLNLFESQFYIPWSLVPKVGTVYLCRGFTNSKLFQSLIKAAERN
jgi:hypothetical protein